MGKERYIVNVKSFPLVVPAGKSLHRATINNGQVPIPTIHGPAVMFLAATPILDGNLRQHGVERIWMEDDVE